MTVNRLYVYVTKVVDTTGKGPTVNYRFRTFTDKAAIRQSKDGYTGLLGNPPQDHLEVTVISKRRVDE